MVPVLPPGMGVLSQAVAVAVWCTPGVPVCRVPDVVRASVGWRLVGESDDGDSSERQVMCGVPERRVPDVVRASGGEGLVRESMGVGLSACRNVDHNVDGL